MTIECIRWDPDLIFHGENSKERNSTTSIMLTDALFLNNTPVPPPERPERGLSRRL